jgi:DNA replication protein DnaC
VKVPAPSSLATTWRRTGRLGRHPLLVIDEVGYIPFEPEAANLFFTTTWSPQQ